MNSRYNLTNEEVLTSLINLELMLLKDRVQRLEQVVNDMNQPTNIDDNEVV